MKYILLAFLSALPVVGKAESLTLTDAKSIAERANEYAKSKNWAVAIAVVNSEGNLLYFQRNEKSYSGAIEASIQKAKSSNAFQRPTKAFVDGIKEGRIGLVTVKDIVAIEGGVPIVVNGIHMGAIGVSGARAVEDEEIAKAALSSGK